MNTGLLSVSNNSPEELDNLIQSFEYENQQIVKFIEKENQLLDGVENEIIQKRGEIEKLQESTAQLDEETKRAHKQFIQNRDNCESLRKTASVLLDHEVALMKKLNSLVVTGEQENVDRKNVLQHYTSIWEDYKAKYESFPLAQTFLQKKKQVESSTAKLEEMSGKIQELKSAISSYKGSDVDIYDMKQFLLAVAQIKLDTRKNCKKINMKEGKILTLEKELKEIKEEKQKQKVLEEERIRAQEAKRQLEQEMSKLQQSSSATARNEQHDTGDNIDGQVTPILEVNQRPINTNLGIQEKSTLVHMYGGDKSPYIPQTQGQEIFKPYMCPPSPVMPVTQTQLQRNAVPDTRANTDQRQLLNNFGQYKYFPVQSNMGSTQQQPPQQHSRFFIQTPPTAAPRGVPSVLTQMTDIANIPAPQTPLLRQPPMTKPPGCQRTAHQPMFKLPDQLPPSRARLSPPRSEQGTANNTNAVVGGEPHMESFSSQRVDNNQKGASYLPQKSQHSIESLSLPQSPQITATGTGGRQTKSQNQHVIHQQVLPDGRPQMPTASMPGLPTEADRVISTPAQLQVPNMPSRVTIAPAQASDHDRVTSQTAQPPAPVYQTTLQPPMTPEHHDTGKAVSQPTTPGTSGEVNNSVSPFDIEKHLERVRMLTKSPAAPQYSTRPMFTVEEKASDKVEAEAEDRRPQVQDNPFFPSFFPDGRGDGMNPFQSSFPSQSLPEPSGKSIFGVSMGSPALSDRGTTAMSFDFSGGTGATPQADSMFSLFGSGGSDQTRASPPQDSFSFNFGGSGGQSQPSDSVTSGFSLF